MRIALAAGNDQAVMQVPLPASVAAGPGRRRPGQRPRLAPDRLDGGAGIDTLSYANHRSGVTVTLAGGADDGSAGERDDVVAVEQVSGSPAADALFGGPGPDRLGGGDGGDRLDGGQATTRSSVGSGTM